LGDLSVLVFFGLVGVMGSYFLHTKQISLDLVLPALSCGLFSIGVLNINNIRDIESDRMAGKFSIPVRIGKEKASVYHSVLLFVGFALSVIYVIIHFENGWQFLFLLTTPLFFSIARAVLQKPSDELDPYLKKMALTTLLFVILFGAGLLVA
jgi:1,4-dihydroxy-2-naphthoate octaprenyltransferase